ncbi:ABC transporter substrate-binding protein/permease [Gluconacetobacter tumulisoli]|uniref:ABC transporter permease subunit n=1 Tax=Gluconacetobacter tumulisoli TaxID=1286189 RepID=A0A7W4PLJ2_9PROT|nr:ABC transporter substrate-binding protein/permease [Gluconacetobacter tumulisoli]MBB2202195.1 ABC transporter permease subunit [Gluconacetobacter tumulisoli]
MAVLLMMVTGLAGIARAAPLRWASDAEANVPFVFHDPANQSRLIGYEYEIAQAIARRLGRPTQFVQNDWDGLIPGLQRGLYDMVIDGIEITPEHEQGVAFSRPYYVTSERITVRRDQQGLDTLAALRGHVVGTLKDTTAERLLQADPGVRVRSYEEETNAYTDLKNGRLDAVLLDGTISLYYGAPDPDLKLVGGPIGRISYGVAFATGNTALRDQVNGALDAMMRDGELHRILARWKLWTPEMADLTGDHGTSDVAPDAWQHYMQATAPTTGWHARLARYVGFLPLLLHGAVLTLAVSACAMVVAVGLGLALALARRYGPRWLAMLATLYVEIVRGTPLLIQILFIFYALPGIGLRLSPFVAGVLALGMNYAAYEAENYRAGLQSVARGQIEAALALNMTHMQALRFVVVPQAVRMVIPIMTNDFISLLKDSSLVSVITLTELSQTYVRLSSTYYDYFGTGLLIGAAYLLLGLPFVRLARMAEARFLTGQRRQGRSGHP